jgi:uncharacterized protein YndB with AHSA1/START domain
MAFNSVCTRARPEAVFAVLDDAAAYPRWVVGARRVRAVEPSWPAVGSRFHHAVGTAAGELHDSSIVLERDRPRRMVLRVQFRPAGTARVEIDVAAAGAGSRITMKEVPEKGLISKLPGFVVEPVLRLRNALSLQRLRHEIERSLAANG